MLITRLFIYIYNLSMERVKAPVQHLHVALSLRPGLACLQSRLSRCLPQSQAYTQCVTQKGLEV